MRTMTWVKMLGSGAVICVGGPAMVWYVTPTEEELFSRYNPELQRKSLANRQQKQEDFDKFVGKLKDYSKSDKSIWVEWDKQAAQKRQESVTAELDRRKAADAEAEARRQEIRNSLK